MIAFRRVVVAFLAVLAAVMLSGPVAATAPIAALQRVAVYAYDAPVYDQPISCTASERGPPTCSVTSVVPAGHNAVVSEAHGSLVRPEASAIAATYDCDGNPQFVQAANSGSTGAETVAAASRGLSALSPALVAAKSGPRTIAIGEDMERVIPFAKKNGADWYKPDPNAPPSKWMENNRQWINDRMDEGCRILDCGPAPGRSNYPNPTSRYYQMELDEIFKRGNVNYFRLDID